MLKAGLTATSQVKVTEENTAQRMGSGDLPVFATPSMVALLENAAMKAVAGELSEEETTVGALMNVTHQKPSGLGQEIEARAELKEVDGRKLTFDVEAKDREGVIGRGTHVRYVVLRGKFMAKVNAEVK